MALSVLMMTGCGHESASAPETETSAEYIAVYQENIVTEKVSEDGDAIQNYDYLDHVVFAGDNCGKFSEHELIPAEHIISVPDAEAGGFLSAQTDGGSVSELLRAAGMPYIYLWCGANDILAGTDPEEYAEELVITAESIREICPESMVIVLGNFPSDDRAAEYNSKLAAEVKHCPDRYLVYYDIFSFLTDTEGKLNEIYIDEDGGLSRAGCRKILSEIRDNRYYNDLAHDGKYQYLYKDIYAQRPEYERTEGKVAYLTFDDGPSKYTPEILEILKENDVKATFFITGWCIDGKEDILEQVANDGHTIGLHSWTHDYEEIYASPEAWLNDFAKVYNRVYDVTGQKPWSFRFPGGSYNNFNKETAETIIAEMKRRGFAYYDWNAATSDATTSATYESCVENLEESLYSDHSVVLMHDSLKLTPQYLQDVIDILRREGYSFETIDTADEVQF